MDNDTISRQAAIEILWEEPSYSDLLNVLTEARDKIKSLPSAERRGRWEFNIDDEGWSWDVPFKCTQCGEWNGRETPYCPNCGARMEEVIDED